MKFKEYSNCYVKYRTFILRQVAKNEWIKLENNSLKISYRLRNSLLWLLVILCKLLLKSSKWCVKTGNVQM